MAESTNPASGPRAASVQGATVQGLTAGAGAGLMSGTAALKIVAGLTHDLKTPLHAMLSLVGVLLREIDGPLNVEQRRQVEGVKRNGEHLLGLINQLLESSALVIRGTQGQFSLVDVEELCTELTAIHLPLAEEQGVRLSFDGSQLTKQPFPTDLNFLRQILANLLGNALKFTERGGEIVLRCGSSPERLWIDVVDSGVGIRWSEQERIIEPLRQGGPDARTAAISNEELRGIGLGLSLVREAVRILGGQLEVKSEVGRGTLVSVSLPRAEFLSKGPRVAVFEDDPSIVNLLLEIAKGAGTETVAVEPGDSLPFDELSGIIISERCLQLLPTPEKDHLLKRAAGGQLMLIVTFDGSAGGRARLREISRCRPLAKPFNVEELRRYLAELTIGVETGALA